MCATRYIRSIHCIFIPRILSKVCRLTSSHYQHLVFFVFDAAKKKTEPFREMPEARSYYCIRQCISYHPPIHGGFSFFTSYGGWVKLKLWGGFPGSIARQPRRCQHRTIRLRKALGEMFPPPTFWHRHYANCCGDIDHGTSAEGGDDLHHRRIRQVRQTETFIHNTILQNINQHTTS